MEQVGSFGLMAFFAYLTTQLSIPMAHRLGLLDSPTARKRHTGNVPLVGGVAIYVSVTIFSAFTLELPYAFTAIAIICALITAVGALDDLYSLSARYRLLFQLGAGAALAIFGSVCLSDLGDLLGYGTVALGLMAVPFTAICVCGMSNAFNMVDGIDGLAGGLALVSFGALLILALGVAPASQVILIGYIAVALAVFLLFNLQVKPLFSRKIFMGDAGSTLVGSMVAVAMIYFSQARLGDNEAVMRPVTALWLVAVPFMDMAATMIRRILKKKSPLVADRTHLHHILMRAGLSSRQTLVCILGLAASLALFGIYLERVWPQEEYLSFALFLITFNLYFYFVIRHAFKFAVFIRRSIARVGGQLALSLRNN